MGKGLGWVSLKPLLSVNDAFIELIFLIYIRFLKIKNFYTITPVSAVASQEQASRKLSFRIPHSAWNLVERFSDPTANSGYWPDDMNRERQCPPPWHMPPVQPSAKCQSMYQTTSFKQKHTVLKNDRQTTKPKSSCSPLDLFLHRDG